MEARVYKSLKKKEKGWNIICIIILYITVPDKNNLREARKVHAKINAKIRMITQISRGVDYVLTQRKNTRMCMFTRAQKYFIIIVIKSRAGTCWVTSDLLSSCSSFC